MQPIDTRFSLSGKSLRDLDERRYPTTIAFNRKIIE
jgi:hypothetical protein